MSNNTITLRPTNNSRGWTYLRKVRTAHLVCNMVNNNRSPVTNALLERTSEEHLGICNLAVSSMANIHRERLGGMLLDICVGVRDRELEVVDTVIHRKRLWSEEGVRVRIEGLLDAGADVKCGGNGGNTPLYLVSSNCMMCCL